MKLTFAILACLTAVASAGFTPVLNLVNPRGGQRGTDVEVTLSGDRMEDIQEVMFYEPGVTVSAIDPKDGKIGFDFPPRPAKKAAAKKVAKEA